MPEAVKVKLALCLRIAGRATASFCREYQIARSMCTLAGYVLSQCRPGLQSGTANHREGRLTAKNKMLKQAVGELRLELKKTGKWQSQIGQVQLRRDAELLPLVEALKIDHLFGVWCCIGAILQHKTGMAVNANRVEYPMRTARKIFARQCHHSASHRHPPAKESPRQRRC